MRAKCKQPSCIFLYGSAWGEVLRPEPWVNQSQTVYLGKLAVVLFLLGPWTRQKLMKLKQSASSTLAILCQDFTANLGKMVFHHPASAVSTCPLQLEAKMVAVAGFKIQTNELCRRHANSHKPQLYLHLGKCLNRGGP